MDQVAAPTIAHDLLTVENAIVLAKYMHRLRPYLYFLGPFRTF